MKVKNKSNKTRAEYKRNIYPKFIIYSLVKRNSSHNAKTKNKILPKANIFFRCNKCKLLFSRFHHLERHFIEVEYNIRIKCKYCGTITKRIKEHEKICKKLKNKISQINTNNNINKQINTINNFNYYSWNFNNIISSIINDLKDRYDFYEINEKYIYFKDYIIGKGYYGLVVFGVKLDDNTPVAVKIQINNNEKDELIKEKEILSSFPPSYPFPKFFYYESNIDENLLIQSLTGPSLDKLYEFCEYSFDLTTICNIGIDLLYNLEVLHKHGLIHNDLKKNNISIVFKNIENKKAGVDCILIDFGFSLEIDDNKFKAHERGFIKDKYGNSKYASYNSLIGGIIGQKDDIISLCFLLLYFANGSLPWSDIDTTDKKLYKKLIIEKKRNFNFESFCPKNFLGLCDIYNDLTNFINYEIPDYEKYRKILMKIIRDNQSKNKQNYRFKWEKKFSDIIKDFNNNRNFQNLSDMIKIVFKGYPEQISYSYINQYYNS